MINLFNAKVSNFLNELRENLYFLEIATEGDYIHHEGLTIKATDMNHKTYEILLVIGMNKHSEENQVVVMQLQAVTDKERLINHMESFYNKDEIIISAKHQYNDIISIDYKVIENKEEDDSEEEKVLETGTTELTDSRNILSIVKNNFADYEMYL